MQLETGRMDIVPEVTDLHRVLQESIKLLEPKAAIRNIVLSTDKLQSEVCVMADRNKLQQIIVNLLDNAIKYNSDGGNVLLKVDVLNNKSIRLSVVDTGCGMHDKDLCKLFLPFSRLETLEKGVDGTGSGLNLCKELVELMGGRIGVTSHPDVGSCFWIELPYVNHEHTPIEGYVPQQLSFERFSDVNILLVEDNLLNREVAIDMLTVVGANTDVATNGEQAVELFKANKYSLILMDCEMPRMDGYTATRLLRQKEHELQAVSTPIIALTAHAVSGAKEKCIENGMDDFLSKPFSLENLCFILSKWLDKEVVTDVTIPKEPIISASTQTVNQQDFGCDPAVLDCDTVSRLIARQKKNGSKLLSKIIGIYLEQSSQLLDDLAKACQKTDREGVRKISHTLKSSSANVGALRLSELCRTVEQKCEQGLIDNELIACIQQSYPCVAAALNDVLQSKH